MIKINPLLVAAALLPTMASAQPALPVPAALAESLNTCTATIDAVREGRDVQNTVTVGGEVNDVSGIFWPPNHKLRTVTITAENQNEEDCNVTIASVTQDEAVSGSGAGSGQTSPDAANCDNSARNDENAASVDLRGERSGRGTGRFYKVTYTMDDPQAPGMTKTETAYLLVPHDQGLAHFDTYVDEGPLYQSAGGPIQCSQ